MSVTDWREEKYDEVLTGTLRGLEKRRLVDASFRIEDAEGVLKHLYIQDGNDWIGRGELQDTIVRATIAAYESFIAEWKAAAQRPPEQE